MVSKEKTSKLHSNSIDESCQTLSSEWLAIFMLTKVKSKVKGFKHSSISTSWKVVFNV